MRIVKGLAKIKTLQKDNSAPKGEMKGMTDFIPLLWTPIPALFLLINRTYDQGKTSRRNGSTSVKIPKKGIRFCTPLWKKYIIRY